MYILQNFYNNFFLFFPNLFWKNEKWTFINVHFSKMQKRMAEKKHVFSFVTIMLSFVKNDFLFVMITFFKKIKKFN